MLALPGEAACRAVATCPAGKWPEAAADAVLVHVDGSFAGPAPSDGSEEAPFTTIQEAIDAAPPGAVVRIAEGTYAEDLALHDAVTLAGGCPERVVVSGSSTGLAALWVASADGVVVRDLAITGASNAVVLDGSEVLLERVWVQTRRVSASPRSSAPPTRALGSPCAGRSWRATAAPTCWPSAASW